MRCSEGRLDTWGKAASRRVRKQALTAKSSPRRAGAITRTSEDAWSLAERNLEAEVESLRSRINRINRCLAIPVGQRQGATSGYPTRAERFQHQQRLQVLCCRLRVAEAALASGEMSICRGGRRLARARHNLEQAGLTEESWTKRWEACRMFLTADGEAGKAWGNETIRFNPDAGSLEIKLPSQLSHLANPPHGRYRLTCDVSFSYRADDVAAQAASGAVRFDITLDPDKARWYLRAAWKTPPMTAKTLEELQGQQVLGVDLNPAHLAAVALDASGNPLGGPVTIPLELKGCLASTRDAQVRAAISELIAMAHRYGAHAIVIEDLDFEAARDEGREHSGRRPSRGRRGRAFRGLVAGIPTAAFRGRLVQMAANQGLSVIAVDPAYTSIWGAVTGLDV